MRKIRIDPFTLCYEILNTNDVNQDLAIHAVSSALIWFSINLSKKKKEADGLKHMREKF